jgi:hypothetical protein
MRQSLEIVMADPADTKLMLALLALDSYNRGSWSELRWSEGDGEKNGKALRPGLGAPTKIGDAMLVDTLDRETYEKDKSPDSVAADTLRNGFYAAAYDLDGKKVIAIRGTDNTTDDIPNGYSIAAGYPGEVPLALRLAATAAGYKFGNQPQSYDAIEFYKKILAGGDLLSNTIQITGHSMG